ncbi:hypothetical protein AB0P17_36690 [Streptomyces sp. NPDC088124]|uniref:hypothetical protein n=1 Tax=Streptomyces sp. NPDC088124 TaxID=3154654 RepID=UPI00341ECE4F
MAQDSWPSPEHNDRAVTDGEYEQLAARFSGDGVYGSPAGTQVVSAGVGLTVAVRSGARASVRGHAWYSGTSTVTLPVAANSSGQTRTDRVVLRLDRDNWTVRAVIRQGTPGAGAPALVQSTGSSGLYEVPLALVTILSGAGSVTVARAELYVGARIRPALSTARNPEPDRGELVFETDTGRVRLWTGSAWQLVFAQSGVISVDSPIANWAIGTPSVLEMKNGAVHLRLGSFTRTAGTLDNVTPSRLPVLIPSAYRHPTRDQYVICYVTGARIGRATIYSKLSTDAGQVWLTQHPDVLEGQNILTQSGMSWVVD